MIRLMKADLRRILRTKSFYIFNLLIALIMPFCIHGYDAESFITAAELFLGLGITVGVSVFALLRVYSDELHSGTIQGAIGVGVKRSSIIRAKYLDCVIISLIEMLFTMMCLSFLMEFYSFFLFTDQSRMKVIYLVIVTFVKILAFTAISTAVLYVSWGVPAMLMADIASIMVIPPLLMFVDQSFKTTLSELWVDMMLENSYVTLTSGSFDLRFIVAVVIYIAVPLIISDAVFKRKELEL